MDLWQVRSERCKGCGLCIAFCPKECLSLSANLNPLGYTPAFLSDPDKCTGCGLCADVCPDAVIRVYRKAKVKP